MKEIILKNGSLFEIIENNEFNELKASNIDNIGVSGQKKVDPITSKEYLYSGSCNIESTDNYNGVCYLITSMDNKTWLISSYDYNYVFITDENQIGREQFLFLGKNERLKTSDLSLSF